MEIRKVSHYELLQSLTLGDIRTILYVPSRARNVEMWLPLNYDSLVRRKINQAPVTSESGTVVSLDIGDYFSGGIGLANQDKFGQIERKKIENWRLLACLDLMPYIGRTREDESKILALENFEQKVKNLTGLPEDRARNVLLAVARQIIRLDQERYDKITEHSYYIAPERVRW